MEMCEDRKGKGTGKGGEGREEEKGRGKGPERDGKARRGGKAEIQGWRDGKVIYGGTEKGG